MTEKTKLQVYIPESLDTKLRRFIARKYQTFEKGLLSYEVEQAVGHWIALHTKAHKDDLLAPNPLPKVSRHYTRFKQYLLSTFYDELYPGVVIPRKHLTLGIQNTRGIDSRTLKKWIKSFVENGLIRQLNVNQWELIA